MPEPGSLAFSHSNFPFASTGMAERSACDNFNVRRKSRPPMGVWLDIVKIAGPAVDVDESQLGPKRDCRSEIARK